MTRLIIKTIVFVVMMSSILYAADDWQKLHNKADDLFGGWDITVQLKTGLQANTGLSFEDNTASSTEAGPYGKIEITAPLYSRSERYKKERERADFLKTGVEHIQEIEENTNIIVILKKKADVLKAVMKDEGVGGINAYFDVLQDIASRESKTKEARKKLDAMLE